MAASIVEKAHEAEVIQFLRFARYKRNESLREIDGVFADVKSSKLDEQTYTVEEVRGLLDGVEVLVRSTIQSELTFQAHTSATMLQQLFRQAEKWFLNLSIDIADLESQEHLAAMARFEEGHLSGSIASGDASAASGARLPALASGASNGLLQREIERLQAEVATLASEKAVLQSQMEASLHGKAAAGSQLASAETLTAQLRRELEATKIELARREGALAQLNSDAGRSTAAAVAAATATATAPSAASAEAETRLRSELLETQALVRVCRLEAEAARRELDAKVSATTPFLNMKRMVQKKNELIKSLRATLEAHAPGVALPTE